MDSVLAMLIYKVLSLTSGCLCIFFGYNLFKKGVFSDTDVDAKFKDTQVILRRAAPGTVFALFGAAIISFTVGKGFLTSTTQKHAENNPSQEAPAKLGISLAVADPAVHRKIMDSLSDGKKLPPDELVYIENYLNTLEKNRVHFSEQQLFGAIEESKTEARLSPEVLPPNILLRLDKL